jgi:hypothetical protein
VADAPSQLRADMAHSTLGSGIEFGGAAKQDADASLAQLRSEVGRRRIVINPRCTTLVSHLRYGTWNAARTGFDRSEGYGHWDAIDALKYLNRSVARRRNPVPVHPMGARGDSTHSSVAHRSRPGQRMTLGRRAL